MESRVLILDYQYQSPIFSYRLRKIYKPGQHFFLPQYWLRRLGSPSFSVQCNKVNITEKSNVAFCKKKKKNKKRKAVRNLRDFPVHFLQFFQNFMVFLVRVIHKLLLKLKCQETSCTHD